MRHKGSSIIVTGAAGSIGFATCEILAREGAELLMVDIDATKVMARAAELRGKGFTAIAHVADCADEKAVEGYAEEAMTAFGKIDGFFNNAGIEGDLAPTHEYDIAMFDKIIRVNLRSMFLGLRFVIPHMVAAGKGAVVNTASIGSERGLAGACAYNAAKHGAVGLTRTAASEVAQVGVRVNCVMPGVIETPLLVGMLEQMFDGDVQAGMDKLGQVATLNRVGQPREVGDVVSFLLSEEASYVNGAKWEIDGGALATIRNDI
ncbi:SDR family NAD(P)-dependent oxidoreductase [Aurantiacibacter sp. MUD11]|uniref:SDR family NAD(P)-dependent oxidoreductase n=1 Tax=Aurantiacibacter sp. MUD11 TaxID=3003265 RepID=UPI0022AB0A65|nr:SDR family NAD(P)-dependent oxidoreductase [Aurantiacibacter sp. MUD11]WAT17081.1 SDR family NAD(P)-dependent oxidoreductase [Aurantiacibacter sp. MUD11]